MLRSPFDAAEHFAVSHAKAGRDLRVTQTPCPVRKELHQFRRHVRLAVTGVPGCDEGCVNRALGLVQK